MTIPELVALQRQAFMLNHPYSVEERVEALELLREGILRREQEIYQALEQDLGKSLLHFGCGYIHAGMTSIAGVADTGQHIRDGISDLHKCSPLQEVWG